jgi:predicted dehydrogenase
VSAPRYDIVGCGAVVQQYHLPVLKLLQGDLEMSVAGCYDNDVALAQKVAGLLGADEHGSAAAPREGDGVDAAIVATPPPSHAEIAGAYLRAGKSAFVEKPLTTRATEAAELVSQSRQAGRRVAVDHFWRFYPSANVARRWLRDRLDQVDRVEASEGFRWAWATASNYVVEDPYGGVIHDTGAHLVDMILYLLGLDEAEEAASVEIGRVDKQPAREPCHECSAQFSLSAPEDIDVAVDLTITRLSPVARGIKVRGSFGTLFFPTNFAYAPILFQGGSSYRLRGAAVEAEPAEPEACFLLAHRDFLATVRDPDAPSRIDASRFLLLSEILESLHDEAGG